jgi:hypothetical protein
LKDQRRRRRRLAIRLPATNSISRIRTARASTTPGGWEVDDAVASGLGLELAAPVATLEARAMEVAAVAIMKCMAARVRFEPRVFQRPC